MFEVCQGKMLESMTATLLLTHEEAESKMIFHVMNIKSSPFCRHESSHQIFGISLSTSRRDCQCRYRLRLHCVFSKKK